MRRLALILGLSFLATPALAGDHWEHEVFIYPYQQGGGWAAGNLGDVYNSADGVQYIGCSAYAGGVFCSAGAANGKEQLYCSSYDPALVPVALSVNSDTLLQFFVDEYGTCLDIRVWKYSAYAPKAP
jgi:hypothetical protein